MSSKSRLPAVLLLAALLSSPAPCTADHVPSAIIQITPSGFQYAANFITDRLCTLLPGVTLNNLLGVSGLIHWRVNGLVITEVTYPTNHLSTDPTGVTWTVSDLGLKTGGTLKYKILVWGSVGFQVTVTGASATVRVTPSKGPDGKPRVAINTCECSIGQLEVRLNGALGWVVNLFHTVIEAALKVELRAAVCSAATTAVNVVANVELAAQEYDIYLLNGEKVVCRMMSDPILSTGDVRVPCTCDVPLPGGSVTYPFNPPPFPVVNVPLKTVSWILSQYTINAILYKLHSAGRFTTTLNAGNTDNGCWDSGSGEIGSGETGCEEGPHHLAVSLFPQITAQYLGCVVELDIVPSGAPTVTVTAASFSAVINAEVNIKAVIGQSRTLVASLQVTVIDSYSIAALGNYLSFTLVQSTISSLTVSYSDIGELQIDKLRHLVTTSAEWYRVILQSKHGREAYVPIVAGTSVIEPEIVLVNGAVVATCDLFYNHA